MSSPNFENSEFESSEFESDAFDGADFGGSDIQSQDAETGIGEVEDFDAADSFDADSSEMGKTSGEVSGEESTELDGAAEESKLGFSVFDTMLLIAAICVTLATILMFLSLSEFGNILTSYPWRTSDS